MLQSLNPADSFTLMMDHEIRKGGLAGNFCGIVLELDGVPSSAELNRRCQQFAQRFPRSRARLLQQGKRYFWETDNTFSVPFTAYNDSGTQDDLLNSIINKQADPFNAAPVELFLLRGEAKSRLVLRWFHPACDAKGAELVLYHLFQDETAEQSPEGSAINDLLAGWRLWDKIKLAYRSKRRIREMDKLSTVLPVVDNLPKARGLELSLSRFDEQQSNTILAQSRLNAGLTGTSLYFIGCLMRGLEQTFGQRAGDGFCVPYAMNLRKRKAISPVFGNQVSFLFAQAGRDVLGSRKALFAHLREQNKAAFQSGADRAMLPLMQAGSWLTLEKYGRIVRQSRDGRERSSIWFSYTGGMDPEPLDIGGCSITGMYQFSMLTAPPSLAVLANSHMGRLTLSYNYIPNHISADQLHALQEVVATELLGEAGI